MKTPLATTLALPILLFCACVSNPVESSSPIQFEMGASEFQFGDGLVIESVVSSTGDYSTGAVLTVRGSFDLRSRDRASLYLGTTSTAHSGGLAREGPVLHKKVIDAGEGEFELVSTISGPGYPHLTFYDTVTGRPFGGYYFGSGDRLLAQTALGYGDAVGQESGR